MQLTWFRNSKIHSRWKIFGLAGLSLCFTSLPSRADDCNGIATFEQSVGGAGGGQQACLRFVETLPAIETRMTALDEAAQRSMVKTHNSTVGGTNAGAGAQVTANAVAGDVAMDQHQLRVNATQAKATLEEEIRNLRQTCDRIRNKRVRPEQTGAKQKALADCQRLARTGDSYRRRILTREASYRKGGDAALANYLQTKSNFTGFDSLGGGDAFSGDSSLGGAAKDFAATESDKFSRSAVGGEIESPGRIDAPDGSPDHLASQKPASNLKTNFDVASTETPRAELSRWNEEGDNGSDPTELRPSSAKIEPKDGGGSGPEGLREVAIAARNNGIGTNPTSPEPFSAGDRDDTILEKPALSAPDAAPMLAGATPAGPSRVTPVPPADAASELTRYDASAASERPEQVTLLDDESPISIPAAESGNTTSLSTRLAELQDEKLRESLGIEASTSSPQIAQGPETAALSGASRMGSLSPDNLANTNEAASDPAENLNPVEAAIDSAKKETEAVTLAIGEGLDKGTNTKGLSDLDNPALSENRIALALGVPDSNTLSELEAGLGIREPSAAAPLSQELAMSAPPSETKETPAYNPSPEFMTEEAEAFISELANTAVQVDTKPPLAMNRAMLTRPSVN